MPGKYKPSDTVVPVTRAPTSARLIDIGGPPRGVRPHACPLSSAPPPPERMFVFLSRFPKRRDASSARLTARQCSSRSGKQRFIDDRVHAPVAIDDLRDAEVDADGDHRVEHRRALADTPVKKIDSTPGSPLIMR